MGKENTYLAVVNSFDKPVIYVWDHENGDRFKILHNIEAERARDISFFEMGNSVYLLVTSYQQMYVFKGAEAW